MIGTMTLPRLSIKAAISISIGTSTGAAELCVSSRFGAEGGCIASSLRQRPRLSVDKQRSIVDAVASAICRVAIAVVLVPNAQAACDALALEEADGTARD
jgi:hypothetical protein